MRNAATLEYLTADWLWYWPPGEMVERLAQWPVIWELGVVWAEWRRVYGRETPELAGALQLEGRWLPGALERVQRALPDCRPQDASWPPRRPGGLPRLGLL